MDNSEYLYNYLCHYGIKGIRWGVRRKQIDEDYKAMHKKAYSDIKNGPKKSYKERYQAKHDARKNILNNLYKKYGEKDVKKYIKGKRLRSAVIKNAAGVPISLALNRALDSIFYKYLEKHT